MAREAPAPSAEVGRLLEAILARYGYDLRAYTAASMERRIRATMARSGAPSVAALGERLLADPGFFADVLGHLTVHVSDMFRDPSFYRALRAQVIPILRTYPLIRIWHAGCAAGEEAYASAILLAEEGLLARSQIYATDVDPGVLGRARRGVFPVARLAGFADNHRRAGGRASLADHVTVADGHFAMKESLRRDIHFFHHDLVSDHVFGEVHVVFCRNVLIYFDAGLRQRVLGKLAASLCPGGFLCLGASERLRAASAVTLTAHDPNARIYRHVG